MTPEAATPALQRILQEIPADIPVAAIDRLWLFPPREVGGRESGLIVLSLRPEEETAEGEGRRRVVTLHYEARSGRKGELLLERALAEQGTAPAELIPRLIEGVLARLGDPGEDPLAATIDGDAARWASLVGSLGDAQVDRVNGE